MAAGFQLRRLGRTLQALAVLVYACALLPVGWSQAKLLPILVVSATLIYLALLGVSATVCFWTIRELTVEEPEIEAIVRDIYERGTCETA